MSKPIDFDEYLKSNYPQLNSTPFFDYDLTAPISSQQIQTIKQFGQKLIPSPHSSEEQSDFDRTLALLRATIAELFSTNLINYSVVLFQTPEAAVDTLFESFPWRNDSHYIIDPDFQKFVHLTPSTFNFPNKVGATQLLQESTHFSEAIQKIPKLKSQSLLLTSFTNGQESIDAAFQFQKQGLGLHHVLFDATPAVPFHFPNLSMHPFNYYLISLKKICGIEFSALLIKHQAAEQLKPQFYGGGAVAFSCARNLTHRPFASNSKRLENGTPSLISIFGSYRGVIDVMKFVNSPINISGQTLTLSQNVDMLMKKLVDGLNQLGKNIQCEINEWTKEVTLQFTDPQCQDAKELQKKFIANQVIVGITDDNTLCASFGFGVREVDVNRFVEVTQIILSS